MIRKLKVKLLKEGRTYKWFIKTYLSEYSYNKIMSQINGFTSMHNYLKEAIGLYLEDK